ncbi:MAG TPA: hypothetical protein VF668_01320 [Pyrinomonadaceae bacterium]|jgi:hypothetical protein
MTRPFIQYESEQPRFYQFEADDWGRAFESAMRTPLHIWLLGERFEALRRFPPSVFSQYGVVTERSFYCPIFTRTLNGALWVACPCTAGRYSTPCRHLAGAYNFHVWREDAGMITLNGVEGEGWPTGGVLPGRYTC